MRSAFECAGVSTEAATDPRHGELLQSELVGPRIVLVDDSIVVLESARSALEDAGFEVTTVDNPLSLPHIVLRQRPELVLLDINMPAVSGETVTRIIRQCLPNSTVPILLHSDLAPEELERRAKECGASGFIRKTRTPEELATQVRTYLNTPHA